MNIFFYGGKAGNREQEFAEKLFERTFFSKMIILPGGNELVSPLSLKLRCGDIIILCAASEESLNALLSIHEKFESFLIILVLPRQGDDLIKKSLQLRPRYITSLTSNLKELETVVEKMILSGRARSCETMEESRH